MARRNSPGMLAVCMTAVALAFSSALAQEWSNEIVIGLGNSPDLDIDPTTRNLHIIHHDGSVIYTEVDPSGKILLQEKVGIAAADVEGGYTFGATVAADPVNGRPHLCYREPQGDNNYNLLYTFKKEDGTWKVPLRIVDSEPRAYSVRMDIDGLGRAHFVHGYATNPPFGLASYIRVTDFAVDQRIINLSSYRTDDRVEIDIGPDGNVNLILSSPDDLSSGGLVTYYRSEDGGNTLGSLGSIHDANATGRNGNADVFVDAANNIHFVYGSASDLSIGGNHSVRYARYLDRHQVRDVVVTAPGEIKNWHHSLGIASVAASDDGKQVVVVYNTGDGLSLRYRMSNDGGQTWSNPDGIVDAAGGAEGRNKHVLRAKGGNFYLVYPGSQIVGLKILKLLGDPPIANAGGPYTGNEGTSVSFDASKSTDDGTIVRYRWDWNGDGTWDDSTTTPIKQYTYQDNFSGSLIVGAVDDKGLVGTAKAQVTIANVPPIANAGGPYSVMVNLPITLIGSATDPGTLDTHTFKWDLDNDGSFEKNGKQVTHVFSATGSKLVRLQVQDDDGGTDVDSVFVQVVTGAPVIAQIPDQTVAENQAFQKIDLNNYVADPDHGDEQLSWKFFGNRDLKVTIANFRATIAVPDSEWAGSETISFTATDPDNHSDTTAVKFTVTPINDPPIITDPLVQRVDEGQPFNQLILDDWVFDPDHRDDQIQWNAKPNDFFIITIQNRIMTVVPADSEWAGVEKLFIIGSDPAGAADTMQVRYRVDAVNDPPAITGVTGQTITRGGVFKPINFKEHIHDPDHSIDDITLVASGNSQLNVIIDNFIVLILPPHANWSGSESITFTATDAGGASSSITAEFRVVSNNHPPQWLSIIDYSFNEDDTLKLSLQALRARVNDPDSPAQNLQFSLAGNTNIHWRSTAQSFDLYADPNWNGTEVVQLIVFDGDDGRDSVDTEILVVAVADPPNAFNLIAPIGVFYPQRPDSILFVWESTTSSEDPNAEIIYEWLMSQDRNFDNVLRSAQVQDRNWYVLSGIDNSYPGGTLFWKVIAKIGEEAATSSTNTGSVTFPSTTAVDENEGDMPSAFALHQNYPNPFNPQTTIAFALPRPARVSVTVYEMSGKQVASLVDAELQAGTHQVVWNASAQVSGIYLIKLRATGEGKLLYESQRTLSLIR